MNLIFDIGCNKGDFYEVALAKHQNCRIVGVDANPKFVFKDHRQNLELVHAGVSNKKDEELEFYIDDQQTGITTASESWMKDSRFAMGSKYLQPNSSNWNRTISVKTVTLDSLIEKYGDPDLIKIDVEGLEPQVLEGLSKRVGKICFEWTEEGVLDIEKCMLTLHNLGYEKYGLIGYFEGCKLEGVTNNSLGDAHMIEPDEYHDHATFVELLTKVCDPERRINWGMCWAK